MANQQVNAVYVIRFECLTMTKEGRKKKQTTSNDEESVMHKHTHTQRNQKAT